MKQNTREAWSGKLGFIMAAVGSAVGIGSIWKFPYEVGSNGGGVFVLFYLLGLVLIVVPLMLAEFAIGRRGGADPVTSMEKVARESGSPKRWGVAGGLCVVTGFLILSYYCVIGGWTIGYAAETVVRGLARTDAASAQARFEDFLASPWRLLVYDVLFIAIAVGVVARGVMHGIEAAAKVLMPLLGLLMLALAAYAVIEGDAAATLRFLFTFDWERASARTALEALGLGFFSIGVGMGLMITYAAYSGTQINLREVAVASVIADTAISLLAGFAVFPIVFAHGLDAAAGPGLVFVTLPLAFSDMPFGTVAAVAFFLLLFVAALSSAIATFELTVAPFIRRYAWSRRWTAIGAGVACIAAGIPTILSFNVWAMWYPLAGSEYFGQSTFYDLLDHLTSNVLLPLGGFAIAVFAGWVVSERMLAEQLHLTTRKAARLRFMLRYTVPIGIAAATLAPLAA
jgi:neurotransmitter:Na+ symporter, NSS family